MQSNQNSYKTVLYYLSHVICHELLLKMEIAGNHDGSILLIELDNPTNILIRLDTYSKQIRLYIGEQIPTERLLVSNT